MHRWEPKEPASIPAEWEGIVWTILALVLTALVFFEAGKHWAR